MTQRSANEIMVQLNESRLRDIKALIRLLADEINDRKCDSNSQMRSLEELDQLNAEIMGICRKHNLRD